MNLTYRKSNNFYLFSSGSGNVQKYGDNITSLVRNAICAFQGNYSQFSFLISEHHKKLKDSARSEVILDGEVENNLEALTTYAATGTKIGCQLLIDYALRYYDTEIGSRNTGRRPRVSVKSNIGDQSSIASSIGKVGSIVFPIVRDSAVLYDMKSPVSDNSGFLEIEGGGKFYLCQDIPSSAKKGGYKNPRLIEDQVRFYEPPHRGLFQRIFNAGNKSSPDSAWINCWKRVDVNGTLTSPPEDSCYKSTLIIPMTVRGHSLDPQFTRFFRIEGVERAIFGYLCFDHIETNFFNGERDVNIGYILADLMSHYLLTALTYTQASKTFRDATAGSVPSAV